MTSKAEKNRKKNQRLRIKNMHHLRELQLEQEFCQALQRFLDALGVPDAFKQLSAGNKRFLVTARMRPTRIVPDKGVILSPLKRATMLFIMEELLSTIKVQITDDGTEITIKDLLSAGISCYAYVMCSRKSTKKDLITFCELLNPFVEYYYHNETTIIQKITHGYDYFGFMLSRVNQKMYYVKSDFNEYGSGKKLTMAHTVTVYEVPNEKRTFTCRGIRRPAYRIGVPFSYAGIQWTTMTADNFGTSGTLNTTPMPVYIQSHALIRLNERLDTISNYLLFPNLFISCVKTKTIPLKKNNALILFDYFNYTLGYFVAEIVNDAVVLKTFLFVTSSGTPQGDLLDKELNTGKLEKNFLKIDRLSTFVNSDIMQDERVRSIFKKAGLDYLERLPGELSGKDAIRQKGFAADFIKYLQIA